jgi:hypothetical protein
LTFVLGKGKTPEASNERPQTKREQLRRDVKNWSLLKKVVHEVFFHAAGSSPICAHMPDADQGEYVPFRTYPGGKRASFASRSTELTSIWMKKSNARNSRVLGRCRGDHLKQEHSLKNESLIDQKTHAATATEEPGESCYNPL